MIKRKIKELIEAGEWNSDEFKIIKQKLLRRLDIQDPEQESSYIHAMLEKFQQRLHDLTKDRN